MKVSEELRSSLKERDVLETESAIRVFERAWSWVKIVGGIAAVLFAIVGGGVVWQVSDWKASVQKAKQSVAESAHTASATMGRNTTNASAKIATAAKNADDASRAAASQAIQLTSGLRAAAATTKQEISQEAAALKSDVSTSREELDTANKLQPEIVSLQNQLTKANEAISVQQKTLSSTESLAKQIFSQHATAVFSFESFDKPNSVVTPAARPDGQTAVYMLLPASPVEGTLQLQYSIFLQLPTTYIHIHNLVIFFWVDPADNLKQKPISISYFPDKEDHELIQKLSVKDGRVYADDQPMPKFGAIDADFKGNKWMPFIQQLK